MNTKGTDKLNTSFGSSPPPPHTKANSNQPNQPNQTPKPQGSTPPPPHIHQVPAPLNGLARPNPTEITHLSGILTHGNSIRGINLVNYTYNFFVRPFLNQNEKQKYNQLNNQQQSNNFFNDIDINNSENAKYVWYSFLNPNFNKPLFCPQTLAFILRYKIRKDFFSVLDHKEFADSICNDIQINPEPICKNIKQLRVKIDDDKKFITFLFSNNFIFPQSNHDIFGTQPKKYLDDETLHCSLRELGIIYTATTSDTERFMQDLLGTDSSHSPPEEENTPIKNISGLQVLRCVLDINLIFKDLYKNKESVFENCSHSEIEDILIRFFNSLANVNNREDFHSLLNDTANQLLDKIVDNPKPSAESIKNILVNKILQLTKIQEALLKDMILKAPAKQYSKQLKEILDYIDNIESIYDKLNENFKIIEELISDIVHERPSLNKNLISFRDAILYPQSVSNKIRENGDGSSILAIYYNETNNPLGENYQKKNNIFDIILKIALSRYKGGLLEINNFLPNPIQTKKEAENDFNYQLYKALIEVYSKLSTKQQNELKKTLNFLHNQEDITRRNLLRYFLASSIIATVVTFLGSKFNSQELPLGVFKPNFDNTEEQNESDPLNLEKTVITDHLNLFNNKFISSKRDYIINKRDFGVYFVPKMPFQMSNNEFHELAESIIKSNPELKINKEELIKNISEQVNTLSTILKYPDNHRNENLRGKRRNFYTTPIIISIGNGKSLKLILVNNQVINEYTNQFAKDIKSNNYRFFIADKITFEFQLQCLFALKDLSEKEALIEEKNKEYTKLISQINNHVDSKLIDSYKKLYEKFKLKAQNAS
ncbi:MAG: hypothetical protein RLZZ361_161 [Cyanobacteriota bacterium]|jgi:hypothetical protein